MQRLPLCGCVSEWEREAHGGLYHHDDEGVENTGDGAKEGDDNLVEGFNALEEPEDALPRSGIRAYAVP